MPPLASVNRASQDLQQEHGREVRLRELADRLGMCKYVLRLRYGLAHGREHALTEIAEQLGVTSERVRQLRDAGLKRLCKAGLQQTLRECLAWLGLRSGLSPSNLATPPGIRRLLTLRCAVAGTIRQHVPSRLVQIPRHLLHVRLDDLSQLGVPTAARDALRALLADLPLVPDASSSAQLIGPPALTLPCLAVLARHVGQGLRDQNLAIAHDRERLASERAKLIFLPADLLADAIAHGDARPFNEAVVIVTNWTPKVRPLLASRDASGLATFLTTQSPIADLTHWRRVDVMV